MVRHRIVICWTQVSGYLAACLRALAARPEIDLLVLAFRDPGYDTAFRDDDMSGFPCRLLDKNEQTDEKLVASLVVAHAPESVAIPGWGIPAYRALVTHPGLADARKLMAMDTPWRRSARKYVGSVLLRPFLRKVDRVMVAGERSWQYAVRLGVPEAKLRRGMYACDYPVFAAAVAQRQAGGEWPRKFLFTGRYVQDKAIDVLMAAYAQYRPSVSDPWPLTCCGKGPLVDLVRGVGVEDRGFVHPSDLPGVMAAHGALVLSSRYEPWGVVVAEASAAGLPVICTESVGASVELVRSHFNGLTVATDDPAALAAALRWTHDHYPGLPELGRRGHEMAAAFSADMWADRWLEAMTG